MADHVTPTYRWSDAWLLLATAIASREAPASLASIIAIGDGIQHAIFTHGELDGGFARLIAGGLVEHDADRFAPSTRGRDLVRTAVGKRTGLLDQQHALEQLLGASAWSAEPAADAAVPAEGHVVSAEQYHAAVRHYA